MALNPQNAPGDIGDELRRHLDENNRQVSTLVNRAVAAAYGGLRTSAAITGAVTTAFATFIGWDTDMPDQSGADGVLVDSTAGTLRVKSAGVYQLHFHAQGYGPASAMDWQLMKNGALYAAVPTENVATSPNAKYMAGIALQLQLDKGDTLAAQWRNAVAGTADMEGSMALHRISPAFD